MHLGIRLCFIWILALGVGGLLGFLKGAPPAAGERTSIKDRSGTSSSNLTAIVSHPKARFLQKQVTHSGGSFVGVPGRALDPHANFPDRQGIYWSDRGIGISRKLAKFLELSEDEIAAVDSITTDALKSVISQLVVEKRSADESRGTESFEILALGPGVSSRLREDYFDGLSEAIGRERAYLISVLSRKSFAMLSGDFGRNPRKYKVIYASPGTASKLVFGYRVDGVSEGISYEMARLPPFLQGIINAQ